MKLKANEKKWLIIITQTFAGCGILTDVGGIYYSLQIGSDTAMYTKLVFAWKLNTFDAIKMFAIHKQTLYPVPPF